MAKPSLGERAATAVDTLSELRFLTAATLSLGCGFLLGVDRSGYGTGYTIYNGGVTAPTLFSSLTGMCDTSQLWKLSEGVSENPDLLELKSCA